jgi:hypothetical protein
MSSEQPPNPIVNTFNPEYWRITADDGITTQFLDANYLKFPLSQNAQETFVAIPNISATMPPSTDNSNKIPTTAWVQGAIGAGSVPNLQGVLNLGNTATGANAKIGLTDSGVGGLANPTLTLQNSNATINTIPTIEFNKTGRNLTAGEIVGSISMYGLDAGAQKTEWSRIQVKTENVASGNEDGTLSIFTSVNGVISEVFNFNGAQNENNSFRPIDLNGNNLRTTSGNMTIEASASSGTGDINITAKGGLTLSSGASSNTISNSNFQLASDKGIYLTDSLPNVVATSLVNAELRIADLTALSKTITNANSFFVQNDTTGESNTYSLSGFTNSTNSIQANTSNGFVLNYGSTTNKTTLDLTKLETINSGANNQDTILLQNTGSANPVLNIQTYNSTTAITDAMGASTINMGLQRINNLTFATKSISINNPTTTSSTIQHTDNIDNASLIISTNNSLDLNIGQDFILNGANIISGSASGNSGQHLRILLNGTYYKIKLEND